METESLLLITHNWVKDTADDEWLLTLQLKDIVDMICAQKISLPQVAYLDVLIQEYLESRKALFYESSLKPKHHYYIITQQWFWSLVPWSDYGQCALKVSTVISRDGIWRISKTSALLSLKWTGSWLQTEGGSNFSTSQQHSLFTNI